MVGGLRINYSKEDIAEYLIDVRSAVETGKYQIVRNQKRPDNNKLFEDYVIDTEHAKTIIMSLEPEDFSDAVQNEHIEHSDETLYIFGKEVSLTERFGTKVKNVPLYIKTNKVEGGYVFVISFHEQKFPLEYYFK